MVPNEPVVEESEIEIENKTLKSDIPPVMMFWQMVAGTVGAGMLLYLVTLGWLLISGVDASCGTAATAANERQNPLGDLAGMSDCLLALRGLPEFVLGIGSLAVGSMLGVLILGFIGKVRSDLFFAVLVPIAVLVVLRLVFDRDFLNLRLMMYHAVIVELNWELLRACGIAAVCSTLGYFGWRR